MRTLIDFLAQTPNPFAGAVVSEREVYTLSGDMPDVESIHREARKALREGLARARLGSPQLCVIVGEAGDGKTHLLAWLRRQQQGDFVFVSVPPLPDPGEPFRHTLRHLLGCLRRPDAHPADVARGVMDSPLSRLIWGVLHAQALDLLDAHRDGSYDGPADLPRLLLPLCEDASAQRDLSVFAAQARQRWPQIEAGLLRHMLSLPTESPLDAMVRTVLTQYPHDDKRALCAAWLAGEDLGEGELGRLSVKQAVDNEAGSRRLLTWFCRLCPVPVVMCFDQIEGITDRLREPGLRALSEVVREVAAHGGATFQVITCHAGVWPSLSDKLSPVALKDGYQQVTLSPIEPAQVRDLVVARLMLCFAGGPSRPIATYPFDEDDVLSAKGKAGLRNARNTLRHFEAEFERRRDQLVQPGKDVNASTLPPPVTDEGVVEAALQRALSQVHTGLPETLPGARAVTVRVVIKELCDGLQKHPQGNEVTVISCDPILGGGLRLTLQVPGPQQAPVRVRAAFEVSNADTGPALFGAATRLGRQVTDGRTELALLLREDSLPIGTGVRITQQSLTAQLGPRGGILWLTEDEVVELLAIERVLNGASAGELSAGPRVLSRVEVLGLLLRNDRAGGLPGALVRLFARLRETAQEVQAPPEPARPPGARSTMKLGITPLAPPDGVAFLTPAHVPPPAQEAAPVAPASTPGSSRPTQLGLAPVPLKPPPAPAPAPPPPRQTLMRMPVVARPPQNGLTAQEILQVIGERLMIEERMLAKELGIAPETLPALLSPLEQQGLVRVTSRGDLRVVLRLRA